MNLEKKKLIVRVLSIVAIVSSVISLTALFELGAQRWTEALNGLSLILIFVAFKAARTAS